MRASPIPDTSTWPGEKMARKRVAVLISGRGSNMASLIEAARDPAYPAEIVLVVSNRPDAAGLDASAHRWRSRRRSSTTLHSARTARLSSTPCKACLMQHHIDIVCLAGFMRLLTPWLVRRWEGRMLNIHPALLPAFKGLDTHERALAAGVKQHGATVHFVVPEMDAGPIIAQAAVPVHDGDTADKLAARVLAEEHRLYPAALKLVAEGRVAV